MWSTRASLERREVRAARDGRRGTTDDLKALVAKPFDAFDFAPAALSVYQLGDFGTARKKLKTWQFTP
jgi:hypothetical protein